MWRGDTMLIPAAYWGIFLGTDGGPWQWICEEAINANQARQLALVSDGTLYATDRTGLTVSRDNGCSWEAVTSMVSSLQIVALLADPQRPRVWALSSSSDGLDNGLFYSDDAGRTFVRGYAIPNHLPSGLRVSDDGQTLVVSSVTNALPRQAVLHVSRDGGMNFTTQALTVQVDGQPLSFFKATWIDPRPPAPIYIQTEVVEGTALLRIDGTAQPVEVLRAAGVVTAMALNPPRDLLFVATTKGLYSTPTAATAQFSKLPTLAATQCLSSHKGTFYACAWNFAPDQAAIARLSNDAASYSRVFQFSDTKNYVECPAGTPVAQICPMVWLNYADQLGINLSPDMGTPPPPAPGCSCEVGGGQEQSDLRRYRMPLGGVIILVVGALAVRRRRASPKKD